MSQSIANGDVAVPVTDVKSFYKMLLENSSAGIGLLDASCNVKYCMSSVRRILGYEPASRIGKNFFDIMHPDDADNCKKQVEQFAAAPGKSLLFTARFKHHNGSWKFLDVRMVNMLDNPLINSIYVNYHDVTERVNMSNALQESEERYRNLTAVSPVGIFKTDAAGNCTYVNEKWCQMSGLSYQESMGEGWAKGIHPDDLVSVFSNWQKAAAKKEPSLKEYRLRTPDGKITKVYCQAIPEKDEAGNVIGYIGSVTDISERAAMEQALQESEERYRHLVENAPETIFIINAETGAILDFTDSALKLFGYTRKRLLQMNVLDLVPEFQPDGNNSMKIGEQIRQRLLKRQVAFAEGYLQNSKGKTFPCEVRLTRIPPFHKKLVRGTVIDISEKKKLQEKLRAQEMEYKHLASVSPVGIFRTDKSGNTIYVNEKWCEITGITPAEAFGTGWTKAIHPDDRAWALKGWKAAFRKKKRSLAEFRFLRRDGKTKWVLGDAVPDYDGQGNFLGYAGSITDITGRVNAELALAQSEQRHRALLDAIPDMLFRVAKDGKYLDFKPAAEFKPLFPPGFFLGKKIADVMPPQITKPAIRLIRTALRTKETQSFEYSLGNAKTKQERFYEARISPSAKDEVLILVRDITRQKQAELSMRASEVKWRSLVTSAPQYIATIDKNDRITFINHLRILKPKQVLGKSVFKLLETAEMNKQDLKNLLKQARNGKSGSLEFSMRNPLGEIMWFNVKVAPVASNNKKEDLIVMALDITERKNAEQELVKTNEKLKALCQRLETIREEEKKNITLEIHDQLGQELTAIKLGMFWLQQYFARPEEHRDIIMVQQKIKSLLELSSQTITSARRLAHQLRPIVLDNLGLIPAIEWQVANVNESGNVQISLQHNLDKEKFNRDFSITLFRIIQESLTNIQRHSKARHAFIDLYAGEQKLVITIRDDGIGIKPADLEQPGKIGIFGIKERIRLWNGELKITGKPGKGTLKKVIFPMKKIVQPP